jgi:S1-C subfamily serine protease
MNKNLIEPFYHLTLIVGRVTPQGVNMLGTGFLMNAEGLVATTYHAIGNDASNLVILMARKVRANDYQDMSDTQCELVEAKPFEIDPVRDIAILKTTLQWAGELPRLGNLDTCNIADSVSIFGYPHCTQGRRAFTFQATEVGAKVLMDNQGIKSRHAVINTQARPGQSGSPVIDTSNGLILGMLIGAWVPGPAGVILGDINPYELHQTTHCISAHHIKEML